MMRMVLLVGIPVLALLVVIVSLLVIWRRRRANQVPMSGTVDPSFEYFGKTVLHYHPMIGNQIEYIDTDGRCYLWCPGKRELDTGDWRVDDAFIWFKYDPHVLHPLTGEPYEDYEPQVRAEYGEYVVETVDGDIFRLKSGRVPYKLFPHPQLPSLSEAASTSAG